MIDWVTYDRGRLAALKEVENFCKEEMQALVSVFGSSEITLGFAHVRIWVLEKMKPENIIRRLTNEELAELADPPLTEKQRRELYESGRGEPIPQDRDIDKKGSDLP